MLLRGSLLLKPGRKQWPTAGAGGGVVTMGYGGAAGRLIFRAFPRDKGRRARRRATPRYGANNKVVRNRIAPFIQNGALRRRFLEAASAPHQRPSQTLGRGVDSPHGNSRVPSLGASTLSRHDDPGVAWSTKLRRQHRNGFTLRDVRLSSQTG